MKKKQYSQPVAEIIGIMPLQLLDTSPGWSKDGNPPITVEREDGVNENDRKPSSLWDDDSYGGFLDLD